MIPTRPRSFSPPPLRQSLLLFALMAFSYAYFFNPDGWNQESKVDTMRAIAQDHTFSINRYMSEWHDTFTLPIAPSQAARYPGLPYRLYSNKPPGTVFLGVPAWAAAHALAARFTSKESALMLAQYASTFFAVGLPAAAMVTLVFCWLVQVTGRSVSSVVASVGLGLGTLIFPYSTMHYSHATAASFLFVAFYALWVAFYRAESPWQRAGFLGSAGFLCAYSVAVEYPAAVPAALILVYGAIGLRQFAAPRSRWGAAGWLAGGVVVGSLPLLAYNVAGSGPRWFVCNASDRLARSGGLRMDMSPITTAFHAPAHHLLFEILFGLRRGLLVGSPWLLLGAAGLFPMARSHRREALLFACIVLLHLTWSASFGDSADLFWAGEWSCGPRQLVTILPFVAAAAAFWPRGLLWGLPLVLWSVFLMLVATSVCPHFDPRFANPFFRFGLPAFAGGQLGLSRDVPYLTQPHFGPGYAWNLGRVAGLRKSVQLVPLYAVWGFAVALLLDGWRFGSEEKAAARRK